MQPHKKIKRACKLTHQDTELWTDTTRPKKNNEPLTKAICNKGFSGNSSILPRSNFGVGGQESSPQSLAAYSLDR